MKIYLANLECSFKYITVEGKEEIDNTLKTVYEHFNPKCNPDIPTGKVIDININ